MSRTNRSIKNIANVLARTSNITKPEHSGHNWSLECRRRAQIFQWPKIGTQKIKSYFYGMVCAVCECSRFEASRAANFIERKQKTRFKFLAIRPSKTRPSMVYMIACSCESFETRTCRAVETPPSTQYFR